MIGTGEVELRAYPASMNSAPRNTSNFELA
jgi:hypothetical protein